MESISSHDGRGVASALVAPPRVAGGRSPERLTTRDPLGRAPWTLDVDVLVVVGAPRSGTTWIQALLAHHPEVVSGPETHFFRTFAPADVEMRRRRNRPVGIPEYWSGQQFIGVVERMFWGLVSSLPAPDIPARFFLEKTPAHCLHAEFILRVLPRARFLHVIRDGRAVAASLLRASRGWGSEWAPDTLWSAADRWGGWVRAGRGIRDLVSDPDAYREVRYEEVRRDPKGSLGALFDWLGLIHDMPLVAASVAENDLRGAKGDPFASIATGRPNAAAEEDIPYPEGFVGPAPVDVEDIDLSPGQMRKFEMMEGPLLTELGYPLRYGRQGLLRRALLSDRARGVVGLPPL